MAVFKCKMCGGSLDVSEGVTVVECGYCDTKQTVPNANNEKKMSLFSRAHRLRANNEFDKASGIYESIIADFPEEAEAYWGLVLCKYGIEYVDDPATAKKIPTCHRSSFESVMDDSNLELTLEYADSAAHRIYREEARQIEEIRKGIIEVSSKEEPYDIFICYKETDANGDRTIDSVLAQDIYEALTDKGYRTFFARISLEDKLGQEYEPYIFAALNSAKIMLAVGTDYEYYHAVWVKNEWSRFLRLMESDKTKHLIPCYKSIDAYDIPKEFAKLQAQDLGKIGAMQDLLRGIEKILPKQKAETIIVQQSGNTASSPNVESYLKRAFLFLEDGDWASANEYCEKVLDINPECGEAYLGKLMAELKLNRREDLKNAPHFIAENGFYKKAIRFGNEALRKDLQNIADEASKRFEKTQNRSLQASISAGDHRTVGLKADGTALAVGSKDREERGALSGQDIVAISVGDLHTVGLKADGTVVAVGENEDGRCEVSDWKDIVAVSAGKNHTVGLKTDGTALAVGENEDGRCNVSDWKGVAAVSAGLDHTVGLKADGTVVAVGDNKYGQCNVSAWKDVVSIFARSWHTVGLKSDGTVLAIGKNDDGQCNVLDWKNIVSISANTWHTVGLKADRTVLAVGSNEYGRCNVSGWNDVVAISTGYFHTVGLKADGTVLTAGSNEHGQCKVSGWKNIVAIFAGAYHTIGLKSDGTAVAVGTNRDGQRNVADWKDVVAIAAGRKHTVGLKSDGTALAVGCNEHGQCNVSAWNTTNTADTEEAKENEKQQEIETSQEFLKALEKSQIRSAQVSISAGLEHTIGIKEGGAIISVGGSMKQALSIGAWKNVVAIFANPYNTVGLKADGTVAAVGFNEQRQREISGWRDIVAVAAGNGYAVGLKADGTVLAVGSNAYGQCNVADWRNIAAISSGRRHTIGIKSNGTVLAVGENENGQCNVGEWKDIVAVSAGENHTVGLKADGTAVAVGSNFCEQCNVSGWKDIVAISAGYSHTVGLKADGTVVSVGFNMSRQCNVASWRGIVAISAGKDHTVGLKVDGTVVAIGGNWCGQCNVSKWNNVAVPILADTKEEFEEMRQQKNNILADRRSKLLCQHCGGTFRGLFTQKCSVCGAVKDYN